MSGLFICYIEPRGYILSINTNDIKRPLEYTGERAAALIVDTKRVGDIIDYAEAPVQVIPVTLARHVYTKLRHAVDTACVELRGAHHQISKDKTTEIANKMSDLRALLLNAE